MTKLLFLLACSSTSFGKLVIDPMKHHALQITASKFDGEISTKRDWQISSVMFYSASDKASEKFFPTYDQVALDLKRMVKVATLNCDDWPVFCKDSNIQTYPTVMVYPRLPIPPFVLNNTLDVAGLKAALLRQLPSEHVKTITAENIDVFLASDEGLPKVFLFTDKKGVPSMFKALSNEFRKDMNFGIVSGFEGKKDEALKIGKRFGVTKFPTLLLKEGTKKPEVYNDKKLGMDYMAIYDWVNLRRETFGKGGGFDDSHKGGASGDASKEEVKVWRFQQFPELTKESHQEVCFKKEGLCVIYLKSGPALVDEETKLLEKMEERFRSHIDGRGVNFRWMWMNVDVETNFKELFGADSVPSVVVFNPHKRLRFTKNEEPGASEEDISKLMDKVLGGDARFTAVKGQKLPEWSVRRDEL